MENFLSLKDIYLGKLNNAELGYFMDSMTNYIVQGGAEALHVSAEQLEQLQSLVARMNQEFWESTISDETREIQQLIETQRQLFTYMRMMCRNAKNLLHSEKGDAARSLYPQLAPRIDPYHMPQMQFVQTIDAVLLDLGKEECLPLVHCLGLQDAVAELTQNNARIITLVMSRTQTRVQRDKDSAKQVRQELQQLYRPLTTYIWAQSIVNPSPELTEFIARMNKLIDDTNAAYKRRTGQKRKNKAGVEKKEVNENND